VFLRFAGTLVLVLALFNMRNSLAMLGIDPLTSLFSGSQRNAPTQAAAPAAADGVQEVSMRVTPYGFEPDSLTIRAGVPVRWIVDGTQAQGCTSGIMIPSLNITRTLRSGPNVIEFTAPSSGTLPFSCTMGMVRGTFTVL
jgi:plastocyanin domain-containing protein